MSARGITVQQDIGDDTVLPAMLDMDQAAMVLGTSLRSAYRAAERGEIPVFRMGRRVFVPTGRLLTMLGMDVAWAARLLSKHKDGAA